jgi:hypothetical protein
MVTVLAATFLPVCLAGASLTLPRLDRFHTSTQLTDALFVPSAKVLQRMSLGYTGLMADIYWTRVVQYFGSKHHTGSMEYRQLEPLLDITTTLDPHLVVAYEFGATFLSQKPPEGAGDPAAAVRLVESGIRENPQQWRLYYNLGFIQYFERHDYAAAAEAFERGSRVPGALPWMKAMAAQMSQHAGDMQTSRLLWSHLYESTEDEILRANAAKHLRALQVDEDVPALEKIVETFGERTGRSPSNWVELVRERYLRGIPVDPSGRPYRLGPNGRVLVQAPEDLPFITQGLPQGAEPSNPRVPESKN